jgi:putative aldouronate transport system permease protein
MTTASNSHYIKRKKGLLYYLQRDRYLYFLLVLPVLYFFIFKYLPMYGVTIAFKEYNIFKGILESEWIGLDNFKEIFGTKLFFQAVRNTFTLNFLDLLFGFPAPILLALLLNELRSQRYKKTVQTLLYLPHFLSWVIIGGIVFQIFSPSYGLINNLLKSIGLAPIPFLTSGPHWVGTYVGVGIWQNIGWGTIIYLAAIAGVPQELYEAAEMDGANRVKKIWHITLPCIRPTIVILFILNIGRIAMIGFERPFVMGNHMVRNYSEVISTYVYRVGLEAGRFSIATAVGLFQSVVSLIFLILANMVAKRFGQRGIY